MLAEAAGQTTSILCVAATPLVLAMLGVTCVTSAALRVAVNVTDAT